MNPKEGKISQLSEREVVQGISRQQHAMAGATISLAAAHGVALGEACLRISREALDKEAQRARADESIAALEQAKEQLLALADEDGAAITSFVADGRGDGQNGDLTAQDYLCQTPAQMAQATLTGAKRLQAFRPLVCEQVQDDLEMAIALLAGVARSALLLLDSNLRIWPEPSLLQKHEPVLADLEQELATLQPRRRVRATGSPATNSG